MTNYIDKQIAQMEQDLEAHKLLAKKGEEVLSELLAPLEFILEQKGMTLVDPFKMTHINKLETDRNKFVFIGHLQVANMDNMTTKIKDKVNNLSNGFEYQVKVNFTEILVVVNQ